MAFSMNSGGGGGRGRSRFRGTGTISEINIVPLVDVMLVLLVIFMLTAHVMEFGMEVEVPKTRVVKETAQELPVVTITKNGTIHLGDQPININALGSEVKRRFGSPTSVFVRADKDAIWDVIAQVVGELTESGFKINAVMQPVDEADRPRRR